MHNLLEYSKNYSKTSGSLWNYYRDEPNSAAEGGVDYSIKNSKSFDYKSSITGKLAGVNRAKDVKIVVPLKYLRNFCGTLDMPLINCEVSLTLTWSRNCVITSRAYRLGIPDADPPTAEVDNPANSKFRIKDTKLYVPVVTLSDENDNKLLEQLKAGFKRIIKWNKYRSEIPNQTKITI